MTKKHLFFFLFTMTCFILSSCEDAKLAKAVDGKWEANITLKDEYGTPYTQRQIYDFKYQESDDKDGGIVTESTITSMTEEVDDIEVSYTTTSTIKGEWEVIFGDLYFTYNLSTLDVAITNVDYQLSENADFSTKMDYAEAAIGMALLGQELINKDELTEDIRKNAYQSFYEDYESSNNEGDGSYYEDLKIGNNVMSFKTSDIGRMELKRVKTSAKRNPKIKKTKSNSTPKTKSDDKNVMSSGPFSGYINGKYAVSFSLSFDEEYKGMQDVSGSYYYDKNGKENSITVKGRYNTTSEELNLTEYYEDGTPNCRISAVKVPQGFRGTFTTTDGKEMDFFIAPDYSSND